ncbi:MAG: hypothetical protein LBR71_00130 [Synergistaceae bacterium]|jgi:hypothetical protein|nr:hypothetical protein [Synergistaceae bacterium]
MYFLWKRTPHGSIRVSCSGLSCFIERVLSGESTCRSLALAEGETASVTLVLSSKNASAGTGVEEHLASVVAPLGFRVQVIWVDRGTPAAEWHEALSSFSLSPWAWMLAASVVAITAIAGLKGLFWTLFWGTAAWFVSKVLVVFAFKKKILFFAPVARR